MKMTTRTRRRKSLPLLVKLLAGLTLVAVAVVEHRDGAKKNSFQSLFLSCLLFCHLALKSSIYSSEKPVREHVEEETRQLSRRRTDLQ